MIEKAPKTETRMLYTDAILYCQFLDYGGHCDWRMPTRFEMIRHRLGGWYLESNYGIRYCCTVTPVRTVT